MRVWVARTVWGLYEPSISPWAVRHIIEPRGGEATPPGGEGFAATKTQRGREYGVSTYQKTGRRCESQEHRALI